MSSNVVGGFRANIADRLDDSRSIFSLRKTFPQMHYTPAIRQLQAPVWGGLRREFERLPPF